MDLGTSLAGIMGIIGVFFVPFTVVILIVWFKQNAKNKQDKLRAELISKAIEHNQTIPENLFETKENEKNNKLEVGVILIAAGLGISLFFFLGTNTINRNVGIGAIPLFIGIGFLLLHFLNKKQEKKEENDSDK